MRNNNIWWNVCGYMYNGKFWYFINVFDRIVFKIVWNDNFLWWIKFLKHRFKYISIIIHIVTRFFIYRFCVKIWMNVWFYSIDIWCIQSWIVIFEMKNKNILVKYFDTWYVLLNNYLILFIYYCMINLC